MPVHFDLACPFQRAGDPPAAIEMRVAFGEASLTEIGRMAQ
jgi:hypothetical protein